MQAATKLTEELEAIFDTELLSGVLTDKTRGVLHRTRGVLTGLLSAYEKKTQRVQQLDTVHCSLMSAVLTSLLAATVVHLAEEADLLNTYNDCCRN